MWCEYKGCPKVTPMAKLVPYTLVGGQFGKTSWLMNLDLENRFKNKIINNTEILQNIQGQNRDLSVDNITYTLLIDLSVQIVYNTIHKYMKTKTHS